MSFWSALQALGPIGPAMADAKEINRQKAMQDAQFTQQQQLGQAQIDAEKQRQRTANQPVFLGGGPQWNPDTHSYTQAAFNPATGKIEQMDVPGQDPNLVSQRRFDESVKAYKAVTGQDPSSEMRDAMFSSAYGFKAPASYALRNIPGTEPTKGADGTWTKPMMDASGSVVNVPLPNYNPPPKNVPPNTQYMRVMGKDVSQWTPEDYAVVKGYNAYMRAQEALAGTRGAAYNNSRPVQVFDPNNPDQAYYTTAGQAEAQHLPTTQSTSYKVNLATQSALQKYFTSGKGGENIRTLNTAVAHLKLLSQLSTALGNGDIQAFNSLAQSWARATGSPAPTNFEMLRNSLSGEMARVFTGVGATQQEIADITGPLSLADSPQELSGAIDTASQAMDSRLTALKKQYAAGLKGQPAFDNGNQPNNPPQDKPLGIIRDKNGRITGIN